MGRERGRFLLLAVPLGFSKWFNSIEIYFFILPLTPALSPLSGERGRVKELGLIRYER